MIAHCFLAAVQLVRIMATLPLAGLDPDHAFPSLPDIHPFHPPHARVHFPWFAARSSPVLPWPAETFPTIANFPIDQIPEIPAAIRARVSLPHFRPDLPRFAACVQTWINYHGNCQAGHTVRISRFLAYPVQPSFESSALYASLVRIWTCKEGMSFCVMPSQATECPVCPVWFAALVFPQSETRAPRMPQNRPQKARVFPMNVSLFIGPFFREKMRNSA